MRCFVVCPLAVSSSVLAPSRYVPAFALDDTLPPSGRLKGVIAAFAAQVVARDAPQLLIDERHEGIERRLIARRPSQHEGDGIWLRRHRVVRWDEATYLVPVWLSNGHTWLWALGFRPVRL